MKTYLSLTSLLLLFTGLPTFSQEISLFLLGTTGNYETTSGYSISYTIGEVAVASNSNGNFILTQGFQQNYFTSDPLPEPCTPPCPQAITAFPNPVSDNLNIDFFISNSNNFWIEIFNNKGIKVMWQNFPNVLYGERKTLYLTHYPKGIYFFHVYSVDEKISEKFKIIKM